VNRGPQALSTSYRRLIAPAADSGETGFFRPKFRPRRKKFRTAPWLGGRGPGAKGLPGTPTAFPEPVAGGLRQVFCTFLRGGPITPGARSFLPGPAEGRSSSKRAGRWRRPGGRCPRRVSPCWARNVSNALQTGGGGWGFGGELVGEALAEIEGLGTASATTHPLHPRDMERRPLNSAAPTGGRYRGPLIALISAPLPVQFRGPDRGA